MCLSGTSAAAGGFSSIMRESVSRASSVSGIVLSTHVESMVGVSSNGTVEDLIGMLAVSGLLGALGAHWQSVIRGSFTEFS